MIESGTTIGGYRVVRMIGRGGMGVVYEAVQASLGRPVALKVLRPELADDPDFVARFRREARLQASLEHPHVLSVYEVGSSSEGLFLAMKLVTGKTLLDLLDQGELSTERALTLLDQVAGALDAAHEAGLVHRDVKPQNILVDDGDRAYLADFGLTRLGTETTATASRSMLGSVAYVAPEVVGGADPTPASDRYGLAATLFQSLTGDVPFPFSSPAAVLYAHAADPVPSARRRRPELSASLDEVFDRALAKDPAARPATSRALLAEALGAIGSDEAVLSSVPPTAIVAAPVSETPAVAPGGDRHRFAVPTLVAAAVLAILTGVSIAVGSPDDSPSAAEIPIETAEGAEILGSDLDSTPDLALGCKDGARPERAEFCTIVQSELPDQQLLVPSDGMIVGWTVEGASGDVALDAIRPRGGETIRFQRSQWGYAANTGPARFTTALAVEAGDQLGIALGPGATIGASETDGATTERWLEPEDGFYGSPDRGIGTGFDYELALRVEFVPGGEIDRPETVEGAKAANAEDGRVLERETLPVSSPDAALDIELVELKDSVALDVVNGGDRTLRIDIDGLEPGGVPYALEVTETPGEPTGGVGVWWVNPNSGRTIFRFFIVGEGSLESWG